MKKIICSKIFLISVSLIVLVIVARLCHWIPPFKTLPLYFKTYCVYKNNNNDSLYVAGLNRLLDIYEKHPDYKENCTNIKSDLYNYYLAKGDSKSIEYAYSKLNYKLSNLEYNADWDDAINILLHAWKSKELQDTHLRILHYALLEKFDNQSDDENKKESSEETAKTIIAIIDSISIPKDEDTLIKNSILTYLFSKSMREVNRWEEASYYMSLINFNENTNKNIYAYFLSIKITYYLLFHDHTRARYYLDELKDIAPHNIQFAIQIAELEYQLYELLGDKEGMSESLDDLIALSYGKDMKLYNILWKMNSYSKQGYNRIFNFYSWLFQIYYNMVYEKYKNNAQEYDNLKNERFFKNLLAEYILSIGNHCIRNEKYPQSSECLNLIAPKNYKDIMPRLQFEILKSRIDIIKNDSSNNHSQELYYIVEDLRNRVKWIMPGVSDTERTNFWNLEEQLFSKIYSIKSNDSISAMKYDISLITKGILLNSSNNLNRDILESRDSVLINKWKHLKHLKRQTNSYLSNLTKEEEYSVQEMIDSLEHNIIRSSSIYRKSTQTWDINWIDVKNSLPHNATAIEFFHYTDKNDKIIYKALLINNKYEYPKEIRLFEEAEITSLDKNALYDISKQSTAYNLIWKPLEEYLTDGPIYVSLDGILHNINIEAISYSNNQYLNDKYDIRRVSSTREIPSAYTISKIKNKKATLYGNISYNKFHNNTNKFDALNNITNQNNFPRGKHFKQPLRPLKGTKEEIEIIGNLLTQNKFQTNIIESNLASEESFKDISGDTLGIIHLATHSFTNVPWDKTDPMKECGILFSGSNYAYTGELDSIPEGYEDGILSAAEIAIMDLRNTELVVMSSCESALGTIKSDGVFGLQRGFKQAGAQTIIMTLWSVKDETAKNFMIEFYSHWCSGETKREAFNIARRSLVTRGYTYKDWGAFIMLD